MRIALAGNPNSGKTTMYNALTGRNERSVTGLALQLTRKKAQSRKAIITAVKNS